MPDIFLLKRGATSQFEQHVRAVMGLPLGDPSLIVPAAVMINLLGDATGGTIPTYEDALRVPGAALHWYAKGESRPRRKMGHVTLSGDATAILAKARTLTDIPLDAIEASSRSDAIRVGIIMGSDSDLPTMRQAADILRELGIGYVMQIVSAHRTPERMRTYAQSAVAPGLTSDYCRRGWRGAFTRHGRCHDAAARYWRADPLGGVKWY